MISSDGAGRRIAVVMSCQAAAWLATRNLWPCSVSWPRSRRRVIFCAMRQRSLPQNRIDVSDDPALPRGEFVAADVSLPEPGSRQGARAILAGI